MANDGKQAEEAWLRRMKGMPQTVIERFWDARDLRGRNGGKAVADFPKPSDFLLYANGLLRFAEVKSVQSKTSFAFANIKQKQLSTALHLAQAGGGDIYTFYIFSFGLGQWFVMSANQLRAAIDDGRASLKFEELTKW
jgi:penicillin-binding protein-related factor A (putative recombinase)